MNLKRLLQSFKDAAHGIGHTFQREQNFRLQIIFSILIGILCFYFPLKIWEIILVLLLICWVLTLELLNTAIEYLVDLMKPRLHHYVHAIKDIMAAAVLVSSFGAAVIGIIIFLPHFLNLLK